MIEDQLQSQSPQSPDCNGESSPGEPVAAGQRPGPLDDLLAEIADINTDDRIRAETQNCIMFSDDISRAEAAMHMVTRDDDRDANSDSEPCLTVRTMPERC